MTKEEKIKEFVEFCSDLAISNDSVSEETVLNFINSIQSKENNGWVKIESEDDLPKDGHYWVITKEGILTDSPKSNDLFQDNNYWLSNITHYQPIEKPKPPIY